MNTYQEMGYENREDYLKSLADDFDLTICDVKLIADVLGDTEDFDGLVTTLDEYAQMLDFSNV